MNRGKRQFETTEQLKMDGIRMNEDAVKVRTDETEEAGIAVINESAIRDRIYIVRGVRVMLDFELAEIYGYTTKAFNQQVKRNADKFDPDFMFRLTKAEIEELSRSQNVTSIQTQGMKGGRAYLPNAFTESGIYMLMTVLKGKLAISQSKALIRTFRAMKDYIVQNQSLLGQRDYLHLSMQVSDTQQEVQSIKSQLIDHGDRLSDLFNQMQQTVKRSEISPYMLDFSREEDKKEYLILNGQPAKADETYMDIYRKARKTVFIIDNYIGIKTLRLLRSVAPGVSVIIFSDNLGKMHLSDYRDFQIEYPSIPVTFRRTGRTTHDRFIVLDYGLPDEKMFHCGASSKDAGVSLMTAITELTDEDFKNSYREVVKSIW